MIIIVFAIKRNKSASVYARGACVPSSENTTTAVDVIFLLFLLLYCQYDRE